MRPRSQTVSGLGRAPARQTPRQPVTPKDSPPQERPPLRRWVHSALLDNLGLKFLSMVLAVTVFGTPVALRVDAPTFVDMQSAVLWTSGLTTSIRRTAKAGAVIGRGSGEAYQLCLTGDGIVVVQASEGHPKPQHG